MSAVSSPAERSITKLQGFLLLLGAVLIWGIQPLGMKIVLKVFSYPTAACLRSMSAAVFFAIFLTIIAKRKSRGTPPPEMPRKAYLWWLVGGLGLGVSNFFWSAALYHTTVGATSILQLACSVVLAIYGIFFLAEKCTPLRTVALLTALFGMFLVTWNGHDLSDLVNSRYFLGNMFGLLGALGWSICGIAQKNIVQYRSSTVVVAPLVIISGLSLVLPALLGGPATVAPINWLAVALLILTGLAGVGVANICFSQAMIALPASFGAVMLTISPLIGMTCGIIFLGEPFTPYLMLGAPLASAGVAISFLAMPNDSVEATTFSQEAVVET